MSKKGRPPPSWILNLVDGKYTSTELIRLSKTSKQNVCFLMKKYCKEILYESRNGHIRIKFLWDRDKFLNQIVLENRTL